MVSTLVGPIRIGQINRNYYVGDSFLTTIQQAVTFAVSNGAGDVIIPADYTGSDSIAAVTGGNSLVHIIDERHGQRQSYFWFNNAYTYLSVHAQGGILTPQINNYAYVGFGTNPTIQGVVNQFAASPLLHIIIVIEPSYTGSEIIGALTGGDPGIVIMDQRTDEWQNYRWNGTQFVPSNFSVAGDLNVLGDIYATNATLDGDLQANNAMLTGEVSASSATFATCIVDDSPVRTFANTADGPGQGMIWPDIGIPVSLGSTWQSPSIDPSSLATWPATGIPVSSGSAWGTSINPANVAMLNVNNTGALGINGVISVGPSLGTGAFGRMDFEPSLNRTRFVTQSVGGLGQYEFSATDSTSNFLSYLIMDDAGAHFGCPVNVTGNLSCSGPLWVVGWTATATAQQTGTMFLWNVTGQAETCIVNCNNSAAGGFAFEWYSVAPSSPINSSTPALMYLDRNGGLTVTWLNTVNLAVSGSKQFRIPHPLDETKNLVHASLEGPENGLFYRGEAVTKDGEAEVTLPDYFEALTRPEDRSVQLTQIFEDDSEAIIGSNTFSMLMASRVKDGKFRIRSSEPIAKVYWEVKAVRADIDQLEVETTRTEEDLAREQQVKNAGK